MIIVWIWLANVMYGATVLGAGLLWAVRTRQFADMERPRHLANNAATPLEDYRTNARSPSRADRYTWVVLLVLTAAAFAAAIVLGTRDIQGVKPWN